LRFPSGFVSAACGGLFWGNFQAGPCIFFTWFIFSTWLIMFGVWFWRDSIVFALKLLVVRRRLFVQALAKIGDFFFKGCDTFAESRDSNKRCDRETN
jgi:hypothetical protein